MNLEDIKNIKFSYFDVNGYVYPFVMLDDTIEIKNSELKCYMVCLATNLSANGEVFLYVKFDNNEISFRTNYFANSSEYTKLNEELDQSSEKIRVFSTEFDKDSFQLEIEF